MGIDAQRSGASELPDRAVEVRRAQGATTKAIPVWIVEEEQRSDRPHSGPCNLRRTDDGRAQQDPCALRVAAEPGPRYRASGAAAARPRAHLARPPLGIAGMLISQVAFLGTSLRQGTSTAVFRGNDKRFYFLHENDRFFDGFLKKIQGDSAVMVREKRLRSGKVETEEITRHLRT